MADNIIYFTEDTENRGAKNKIDFNSPRTQEAAAKLGLTFSDCVKKYKSIS